MSPDPFDALSAETERTAEFLDGLRPEEWTLPTRCEPLSVFELCVHAYRGSRRIVEMVDAGPVEQEAEKSAVTYFQYDAAAEGPVIVKRAQQAAGDYAPSAMARVWRDGWREAIEAGRAHRHDDPVYRTVFGLMHLAEYLRTRIVEVTIHTMDVRDALGLAPDPTAQGLEATCEVLRGMLGADLRPLGIDDVRFALTATGRAPLDDAERDLLGPVADLFPVLA